ncbi:MAG TPA: glycosyltransferase family 39 protein [Xanthobacteraceae bacterium]|nr:glycosyltransferase family 39 protein [Xanthobacteraceae bacterium]
MLYVSLIFESLRTHPRVLFWTAVLTQAALWILLPVIFYSAPPGGLAITLAVGHEFQLGSAGGPPLAFWLAEIAYRFGGMSAVYVLAQACVVATLWGVFALGRATVGISQAVLAVLLMVGIAAFSVPTPEFNPAILAMPIWTVILLHYWYAVGKGRDSYWIPMTLEMGLLVLTSLLAWVFLLLLAAFTIATPHGRKALRGGDPWLCAVTALLIGLPYLVWLAHAGDIWKPMLARLSAAGSEHLLDWAGILRDIAVAHAGVAVFALLASTWRLPQRERVATVDRPPMHPFARTMIYFFALAPLLAGTVVIAVLGYTWSLAHAGPLLICSGLAVITAAGAQIPLYRQRLLSMAWTGILFGPPVAMALALMILPWTVGIDFKVLYPAADMAAFFTDSFERRTGQPLSIVSGDPSVAALVALEPHRRPSLLMVDPRTRSPWTSVAEAENKGAVLVWAATDTRGTPPPTVSAAFPNLVIEVPRSFERSIQGRLPLLRVGWAMIRPQSQSAPPQSQSVPPPQPPP